jgi:transposase-like protein
MMHALSRYSASGVFAQRPFVRIPSWAFAMLAAVEIPVAGRDYPGTLRDFNAWFPDEEACLR